MAIDNNNNKVLNVPALRFLEFSGEWKTVKIGTITTKVGSGVTPRGGETVYRSQGHPFVRSQNVGWGRLLLNDIAYIDEETHKKQLNTALELNDILLNITGASIGRCAVVNKMIVNGNVNQHVCIIRSNEAVDPEFLCNYLLSNYGQKQIDSFQAGGNRQGLNFEQIKSIRISIPTLDEQKYIAKLLFAINQRIETQNKIIEKYESLIQAISQKVLRPSEYWNEYRLCELADIRSGYSGNQVSHKTAYAVTRIETISKHRIDMLRVGYVQDIPSEYKLNVGDILFSNINSIQYIGNTAFVDKEYNLYHGMNLLRIIPKPSLVIPRFLHLILCTSMAIKHFQSICNKAVSQASINQTSLGKIMLHIPPLTCQEQICNVFESVEQRLNLEVYYLKRIQLQKNYLLRQMFI